ncbi:mannosyltransferase family protein [Amycolatopsis cihanbeyliensis]|uniref:Mannosyltransferase PIG-V n=1 Tax=Amycolatopsis cihanbeyliensis TaxID=1128664 RepID=A0A542DRN6_AMYCI|nr:mannosyltransferase family protein [Amycolatopsis cihanbeyliensis]TQJ05656.1 mannosyltransferase PIG-V [Amycolatopsis cihanbeyliensis]
MTSGTATEDKTAPIPAVRGDSDAPPSRWRTFLSGDFGAALLVVLLWHLALTAAALLFGPTLPTERGVPGSGVGSEAGLLTHTFRWDSVHYGRILDGEYSDDVRVAAFYPLFPFAVWLVQAITFGQLSTVAAGMLINTVASWLAVVALLKIVRYHLGEGSGPWLAVAGFLGAPAAFFLHAFYSEALFCAIGFWAYLFALRRDWTWMGLCLMAITASRITGVLFVGLCFLEFWRSSGWSRRGLLSVNLMWFPAALAGLAGYMTYLGMVTGDALGMFHAYTAPDSWSYHVFNPNFLATIAEEAELTGRALLGLDEMTNWRLVSHVLPMIGLALVLAASCYLIGCVLRDRRPRGPAAEALPLAQRADRTAPVPLAVFGLVSIVMFTLNSNVVSVHRYVLPCLTLYLALATLAQRSQALRPVAYVTLYAGGLLQAMLFASFISGQWAG